MGPYPCFRNAETVDLVNIGRYSFTYPEYPSLAIAKVWAGKADLPCTAELWRRYDKEVKDRGGYSKTFQLLDPERMNGRFSFNSIFRLKFDFFSAAAVRFFRGWLDADAVKYGGRQVCSIF